MKNKQNRRVIYILLLMILFGTTGLGFVCKKVDAATNDQYLIKVNKQQNCVTIYEKDTDGNYTVPVKAMICSTGSATPLGTYNTMTKYRWKLLLDDVWGQYSTRIVGGILFHSVWYYKPDPSTLSAVQYNKLGTTCSHGCVRLTVEDAKWIYDNCPIGTTVIVYNDKDPGPLGKPTAQKLKAGTGWDPTDPDEQNPFNQLGPIIKGAMNQSIDWGSEYQPLAGVTASSRKGHDLTDRIRVTGNVDTMKAGKYKITYTVKDNSDNETELEIMITVKKSPDKVTLKGIKDRIVSGVTKINRSTCMKGVTAYFGAKKLAASAITVKISKQEESYQITYTAVADTGATASKTVNFYVDTEAPVIDAEHVLYSTKTEVNKEFVLQYIKVSDNYSKLTKDDVEVSIEKVYDKGDLVTFTVQDSVGNTSTKTVQFTRTDSVVIEGVQNHIVPKGTTVDQEYVMQGVTGLNAGQDATADIVVTISEPVKSVYTVTYELENKYDVYTKIVAYFTVEE